MKTSFTICTTVLVSLFLIPCMGYSQSTVTFDGGENYGITVPVSDATFGDQSKRSIEGELVFVEDYHSDSQFGCGRIANNVAGKIAVIDRGGDCDFVDKVLNLQSYGAMAVIICNDGNGTRTMGSVRADASSVDIKSVMMGKSHCLMLKENFADGNNSAAISSLRGDDVLWSDDFSDESTWIFTDDSPEPYGWVITDDPEAIPEAAAELFPFASTTAENGYAMIDSDGSPWSADGAGRIQAEITTATPIDLSGKENVLLRFQHNYRWWQDTRGVRVSPDNGDTWIEYEITDNDGFPNEQNSGNPEIETIDISDAVGDAAEVLVQFYYDDNNFWGWYWAVDDVEILRLPDNDLAMDDAFYPPLSYATPAAHLPVDSFGFSCIIRNAGARDRSEVQITVSIINTAEDVVEYQDAVVVNSLLRGADSLVVFDNLYRPELEPGLYAINYHVEVPGEPDFSPEDNEISYLFEVTEDLFAKNDPSLNNFTGGITNEDDTWFWGNLYYISPEVDEMGRSLMSIDLAFVPTEDDFEGENAILYILEYVQDGPIMTYGDLNANSELPPNIHPEFNAVGAYIITSQMMEDAGAGQVFSISGDEFADPNSFIPLEEQLVMNPGKLYAAVVQHEGDGLRMPFTRDVNYGTGVGLLYADNANGQKQYFSGYINISGPIVRMRTGLISSTNEVVGEELTPLHVFPNPAYDRVNIEFDNAQGEELYLDFVDMQGRSVRQTKLNSGQNTMIQEDLNTFQSGQYIIRIISKDGVQTAPLIITR